MSHNFQPLMSIFQLSQQAIPPSTAYIQMCNNLSAPAMLGSVIPLSRIILTYSIAMPITIVFQYPRINRINRIYSLPPKHKSPASPKPGTIYLCGLSIGSITAHHKVHCSGIVACKCAIACGVAKAQTRCTLAG